MRTDLAYAQSLDAADPLAHFRDHFAHPDAGLVYVDGNSLGRMPHASLALANDLVTRQWGDRLIRSWNEGWFDAPERVGAKIAGLLGAQPDEVIVADSTSVNFFKLLVAGLRYARQRDARRTRILTDDLNFPSDIYVIEEAIDLLGRHHTLELLRSPDGIHGPVDALQQALSDDVALLTLSHTVFKSGYTYDMAAVTQTGPRRRRPRAVGPQPLGRLRSYRPQRRQRRPGRRLHLQVSQRRPRRACLPLHPPRPAGAVGQPHRRLDEPVQPL